MLRSLGLTALGLAGMVTLNAGQINLGTGTNGINGLTGSTSLVGGVNTTSANSTVNPNLAVPTTHVSPTTYTGSLFNGATGITSTSQTVVVGTPMAPPNGNQATGEVLSAGGTTFALINDQAIGAPANNDWAAANQFNAGTFVSTFTIPVNVFGVTAADTMLNDEYGVAGAGDVTVAFNFANSSDNLTFTLINGLEIRASTQCTGVGTQGGASGYNTATPSSSVCKTFTTALNTSNRYNQTGSTVTASGASVGAYNVWTGAYTGNSTNPTVAGSPYGDTSGNLFLDAQDFNFGGGASYKTDTLQSIVITDTNTNTNQSRVGLSAITLQTAATPEPSTIFLCLAGFGALALRRRSARA